MDTLFFIFSKLVGLCLQIETWLAVALAIAAFAGLLGRKRLSASLSAAAFVAVTFIGIFPVGEVLLAPLEAEYLAQNIPEHIDGIIVLGGVESPRKTNGPTTLFIFGGLRMGCGTLPSCNPTTETQCERPKV